MLIVDTPQPKMGVISASWKNRALCCPKGARWYVHMPFSRDLVNQLFLGRCSLLLHVPSIWLWVKTRIPWLT